MTMKRHKYLSPPGKTIDIFTDSGMAGTPNMKAFHYALTEDVMESIYLIFGDDDITDDDVEAAIGVIRLIKR